MLFGQRPVSMFPGYSYQPSHEERYYRQLAEEQNRRAAAAQRMAQQERERAAREREIQAMRERQYQEEMARQAHARQQGRQRRPQSQFFGNPDFESPFDMFGGGFDGFHPRARAAGDRRRRQSQPQEDRFSTFLDNLFHHEDEEADEIPAPQNQPRSDRSLSPSATPEPKARSASPAAVPQETKQAPAPTEQPTPDVQPQEGPAVGSPKNHSASFTLLDNIQSQFDTLRAGFTFPATVEFQSQANTPKLTYASVNAPVHQYENELIKLLTKLDAVESDGAASIRGARKALVLAVEKELDRLEEQKRDAWKKLHSADVVEAPAAAEESMGSDSFREEDGQAKETGEPAVTEVSKATEDPMVAAISTPLPEANVMEVDRVAETKSVEDVASAATILQQPQTVEKVTASLAAPKADVDVINPEAVADDSVPEADESEESSVEAAILTDGEESDSEEDAFIHLESLLPHDSDPVMEAEVALEDVKAPVPKGSVEDEEEDFEML